MRQREGEREWGERERESDVVREEDKVRVKERRKFQNNEKGQIR